MLRLASKRLLGLATGEAQAVSRPVQAALPRFYHENVIDHYNNPRNVGSFDKNDPTVGTGLVGAPACGDVMKLQIKVDDKTGQIVDACFKTFGCGSAIASSSVATEWVKGKPMQEVLSIKNTFHVCHLPFQPLSGKSIMDMEMLVGCTMGIDRLRVRLPFKGRRSLFSMPVVIFRVYIHTLTLIRWNPGKWWKEIAKHLSLPPVKLHCSMLAEDAIKAAIKDYEAKHTKPSASPEASQVEKAADA
ncbi:hypothetical protein Pint_15451 [Pistacia integerrima]|uniref:Uncharacterized protein n=1 Tax=Pistacia integerrima TaxID=434235 RepID=A0ACC0ZEJ3_9ROSI|nr:hypothetical protein Pint_15451 [Pistacia integerrima]